MESLHSPAEVRGSTDWNNALKLGFDVHALAFLPGLSGQPFSPALPHTVLQPGATAARVAPRAAAATGLPPTCEVAAGTTDSIAAFLAAGPAAVGDAVTSLGSTLAIKLLSDRPVDDGRYGVYSHRLGALFPHPRDLIPQASHTCMCETRLRPPMVHFCSTSVIWPFDAQRTRSGARVPALAGPTLGK